MGTTSITKRGTFKVFPFLSAVIFILGWECATGTVAGGTSGSLFPEMEGWKRAENILVFLPETLFDYIDGAADLYLSYDFQLLQVAEYGNDDGDLLAVEIYRHRTPVHSFGIYSQERSGEEHFLEVGAQGYVQESILNFVAGRYYVKIISYSSTGTGAGKVLHAFAKRVAGNLDPEATLPQILTCFPQEQKRPHSEKYSAHHFLGHEFLRSGFTAEYGDSSGAFSLFIIAGEDAEECSKMLSGYLQLTEDASKEPREGHYTFADPYHGELALRWKGNYIWGVLNLSDDQLRHRYLDLTEECLAENKLIEN